MDASTLKEKYTKPVEIPVDDRNKTELVDKYSKSVIIPDSKDKDKNELEGK